MYLKTHAKIPAISCISFITALHLIHHITERFIMNVEKRKLVSRFTAGSICLDWVVTRLRAKLHLTTKTTEAYHLQTSRKL